MEKTKLLFVCNGNVNRSPTWEKYFRKNITNAEVKSAGTYYGYPNILTKELLDWAELVYVMDISQEMFIAKKFGRDYVLEKTIVLGISDQYQPNDEDLIEIIKYWIETRWNNE